MGGHGDELPAADVLEEGGGELPPGWMPGPLLVADDVVGATIQFTSRCECLRNPGVSIAELR
jgi:hypothetical protein